MGIVQTANKIVLKDRFLLVNLIISFLAQIGLWSFIYYSTALFQKTGLISLHYNIYFGIDYVGQWYQLFILPSAGLVIFLVNFFLAQKVYQKIRLLSYFLTSASALFQLFLLIAFMLIIKVNL